MSRPANITPSGFKKLMCKKELTKSKTAIAYADRIVMRSLGVDFSDEYVSYDMKRGIELEPQARKEYERKTFTEVTGKERFVHPEYDFISGEPDGLISDEGLIEIKCPRKKWHLANLRNGVQIEKYKYQMQGYMWILDRKWCDFVSYDPRFPEGMKLCVKRVKRDKELIDRLEKRCVEFWEEIVTPKMEEFEL